MPRNGSGVYSLPASNPVIDGTIIDVNWANPTMSDIATQLNNVYTRDGLLGPTGPFRVLDGLVSNPGLGFSSETTLGMYRPSTNVIAFAAGGAKQFSIDSSGATSTVASLFPKSSGDSRFVAFSYAATSGDLSGAYMGADASKAFLASLGSTGVGGNYRDLELYGASIALKVSGYTLSLDPIGLLWIPNSSFMADGAYYGFTGSGTTLSKYRLNITEYLESLGTYTATPYSTEPAGMAMSITCASDGAVGNTAIHVDGADYAFTESYDAQKNGGAATWTVPSARSLKKDIEDYTEGLREVLSIRPRTYKYLNSPDKERVGIVADEMVQAMPRCIVRNNEGGEMLNLDPVVWALVNTAKELHARLSRLETISC